MPGGSLQLREYPAEMVRPLNIAYARCIAEALCHAWMRALATESPSQPLHFEGVLHMKITTPGNSGMLVAGVGETGSAGDGEHVFFELIFPSGHRDRFRISFSDMDAVVLGLQAALAGVAKEFAGRPEAAALRGARPQLLENFAGGIATGPGLPPVVALSLKFKSGLQNNLLVSPDAAERLGRGLIDLAGEARAQQPVRTN